MEYLIAFLKQLAHLVVFDLFKLDRDNPLADVLQHFIIGFSEIIILIIAITYIMGIVTSYMPMEKVRDFLEKRKRSGLANLLASLLGAITPFCSCSSIPLFVGMMQARIPLGIALSFLITSPLVNEVAILIFWVSFGWKITLIYISSGVLLGVFGGLILDKLGMSEHLADWIKNIKPTDTTLNKDLRTFKERLPSIQTEAAATLKRLLPYVFVGLLIGSLIHGYVPENFFENYISKSNPLAVPIAVILAIPLYVDAVGVLPIIDSLITKGVPLGTAIAFMMASVGLSLPEALLLKKVMKKKLILYFFFTIGIGMIISGYLFNLIF